MGLILLNKRGVLFVISGPSGTGKDSILRELKNIRDDFCVSVSCTTRNPRAGEVDGEDYFFVSKSEFMDKVKSGEMLEWANFCDNYYGTPKDKVEEILSTGMNVILEIEVQGAKQVIENTVNAVSIFVLPPSIEVLKQRLLKRASDSHEIIGKRVQEAEREISLAYEYKYIVVNDDLKKCAEDISKVIDVENMKTMQNKNIIKEVLDNERVVSR